MFGVPEPAIAVRQDNSFDLMISMFGAMFAPKPLDVAKEMVRVTGSKGRIVMGNWIPNDPTLVAQILRIGSAYSPPPPDGFSGAGIPKESISFVRDTCMFDFPDTPSKFLEVFRKFYGPTMNALDAAEKNGRVDYLQAELENLFNQQNKSSRKDSTTMVATYLRVTVSKN